MYEAQLDDVGARLAARYTPVRDDGAVGDAVTVLTAPIAVDPEVAREVRLDSAFRRGVSSYDYEYC